jgi:hypothetical protein
VGAAALPAGGVGGGRAGEGAMAGVGVRRGWTTPGDTTVVGRPFALFAGDGSFASETPIWSVTSVWQQEIRQHDVCQCVI